MQHATRWTASTLRRAGREQLRSPRDSTRRRARLALLGAAVWAVLAVAFALVAAQVAGDPGTVTTVAGRTAAESSPLLPSQGPTTSQRPSPRRSGPTASGTTPPAAAAGGTLTVAVPDVRGLPRDEAGRRLALAGLRWDPHPVAAGAAAGSVVGQRPAAGRQVPPDTVVKLDIAAGADPDGTEPADPGPPPTSDSPETTETPTPTATVSPDPDPTGP